MKPIIQKLWMFIVLLCASISASAYDFEVDGIYYNIVSLQDLTCEVTKGKDLYYYTNVVIPDKVNYNNRTLSVVAIDNRAFWQNFNLKKVIIPNSVTKIGIEAFSISSLEEITLGNSVTIIDESTFEGCKNLTDIIIPNSVLSIGANAFKDCYSLSRIVVPNSITTIEDNTFQNCRKLTDISIPNSITRIGNDAFYYCESLTEIIIPNKVTTIGSSAFMSCKSLIDFVIPNSVTSIGSLALSDCKNLKHLAIGEGLSVLPSGLFKYCTDLKSITIPGNISHIEGEENFSGCSGLSEIKFTYGSSKLKIINLYHRKNYSGSIFYPVELQKLYIDRDIDWGTRTYDALNFVKELTIGSHISDLTDNTGLRYKSWKNLEVVTCLSAIPPKADEFSNAQYINCVLKVPTEALEAYKQAYVWKNFWNIEAISTTGIESVDGDTQKTIIGRYDLCGRLVSDDYKGISIIRYSDGSTKKILK